MACSQTRIYVHIIPPQNPLQPHHHLPPRSIDDIVRIKQMMMMSHVMLAVRCPEHPEDPCVRHHMAICNCTGLTPEEISDIADEVYQGDLWYDEYRVITSWGPLLTVTEMTSIVEDEMKDIHTAYRGQLWRYCYQGLLKLTSLAETWRELITLGFYHHCFQVPFFGLVARPYSSDMFVEPPITISRDDSEHEGETHG